jgi:5-methylcytosine-specific restriction endonuclease McrA
MFNRLKESATRRGVPVRLTLKEFTTFTTITGCTYCGSDIVWYPRGVDGSHNLDRKDNSQGYNVKNCVVCCGECNRIKSNQYSYSEMLRIGSILKELREL